jgi:hypothetical protein
MQILCQGDELAGVAQDVRTAFQLFPDALQSVRLFETRNSKPTSIRRSGTGLPRI